MFSSGQLSIPQPLQDLPVDPDVAELVDEDREPPPAGVLQQVPDQRRLPRPEKPGDDGAGNPCRTARSWQLLQDVGMRNAGDEPALQGLGPRPPRHEPVGRLGEEPRPRHQIVAARRPRARRRRRPSSRVRKIAADSPRRQLPRQADLAHRHAGARRRPPRVRRRAGSPAAARPRARPPRQERADEHRHLVRPAAARAGGARRRIASGLVNARHSLPR